MSRFSEMIRHTRCHNHKIKKFCAPLFQQLGFNGFFYHYISSSGWGTSIGSHIESFEQFYETEQYLYNPYLRHPKFFQNCVHFLNEVQDNKYQNSINERANQFDIAYKLVILERTDQACEGFSFGVSQTNPLTTTTHILENLPLLNCFIQQFKKEADQTIKTILKDQICIDIGEQFYTEPFVTKTLMTERQKKIEFLKQIKVIDSIDSLYLTPRESECIKLLLRGYSANDTAIILNLSKRTVEHYIENVKVRSGCSSKIELFEKFKIIESLGLL